MKFCIENQIFFSIYWNRLSGNPGKIRNTYADYLEWDGSERSELVVDGEHQRLLGSIYLVLGNFLKGRPCQVFPAPFAVRLNPRADNSDDTVFEPETKTVLACILENGRYMLTTYDNTGSAPVTVPPGCEIDLGEVFADQIV
ncbi:MAG: hypothetical protein LBS48_02420 [Treponema sp.]|jgi:hypothetical protein|nr:hypothetical protein [Treponema sp.]